MTINNFNKRYIMIVKLLKIILWHVLLYVLIVKDNYNNYMKIYIKNMINLKYYYLLVNNFT